MSLERRYRLLLRVYPPAYRAARGAEITSTCLDLAGPDRHWPTPGDVADLVRGGLRERLRASGAHDAAAGVRLAATLALTAAAALASWHLLLRTLLGQVVLVVSGDAALTPQFGPFATVAVMPDAAWLLAAVAAAARSARAVRILTATALVLTLVAVPCAYLTGYSAPPLTVVFPQLGLGLIALALPARRGWTARLAPGLTLVVVTGLCLARSGLGRGSWTGLVGMGSWYPGGAGSGEQLVAVTLVAGTFLAGCSYPPWRDSRWLWAALTLLTPAALLWVLPTALASAGWRWWWLIMLVAIVIAAMASAVISLALKLTARAHSQGPCAACRRPPPPAASPPHQ